MVDDTGIDREFEMRYEFVSYWSIKDYDEYSRMVKELPEDIKIEFIKDRRLTDDPWVEAGKEEVIEYLDRVFSIGKSLDCRKDYDIEIDEEEIEGFTHFRIHPKDLEVDRSFFVDVGRPCCAIDGCFVGSRLLSLVKMKVKKAKSIGIAQLGRQWGKPVELVISAKLREIFDREGVTGLTYEPVEFVDADQYSDIPFQVPYLARITNSIYAEADDVVIYKTVCHEHRISYLKYIHNQHISRESISGNDFVEICGVKSKGRVYNSHVNRFIITRKVLEILLDNKIKGLTDIGFFMKTKFSPCLLIEQ